MEIFIEFSCAPHHFCYLLIHREIPLQLHSMLQKIANNESVERKSNERRESASWCLREQTSTWRFSSLVKSHGSLVWRSASATKISGSGSRDGVAFTRIAMERWNTNDFRVCRLSQPFLHLYSRFLAVPHFIRSSLSHCLIDFPFLFLQSHFSNYPILV